MEKFLAWVKVHAKTLMAAAASVLFVASTFVATSSTAGRVIALLLAALNIGGVYRVPNKPPVPAASAPTTGGTK